jgi:hypothetical protein
MVRANMALERSFAAEPKRPLPKETIKKRRGDVHIKSSSGLNIGSYCI